MPSLSIIVPVYNVKEYLGKCVDSILNQTFDDFEIILVDDGSTDGSGKLCDNYKNEERVRILHQTNSGQSAARNSGLSVASGNWVGFVDSDDWLEPEMYGQMMEAAKKHKADVVICRHRSVSPDGETLHVEGINGEKDIDNIEATKLIMSDDEIRSFAWNKIYHRRLFEDICYPEGRIFEDTATTYKLLYKARRITTIPYIGYNYLANPKGTLLGASNNVDKWIRSFIDNSRAFTERYAFTCAHKEFKSIRPMCARKAYLMAQGFIHACTKRGIQLNKRQKELLNSVFKTLNITDLKDVKLKQKLDILLFRIYPSLMWKFISIIGKSSK